MIEISGNEKKYKVVKEEIISTTYEVLAESQEAAEIIVLDGNTIGIPIWNRGSSRTSRILNSEEL